MSGLAKIISTTIVLLLLIGLAFGIFSFVDSSKKANERLNSDKTEQNDKKKNDKKDKDQDKDKDKK